MRTFSRTFREDCTHAYSVRNAYSVGDSVLSTTVSTNFTPGLQSVGIVLWGANSPRPDEGVVGGAGGDCGEGEADWPDQGHAALLVSCEEAWKTMMKKGN